MRNTPEPDHTMPADTDKAPGLRIERELRTIDIMIAIHCRGRHGSRHGLCIQCAALQADVRRHMAECPLLADKPSCGYCPANCYPSATRQQLKAVMRYSGPRMLLHHPLLAILHLRDARRDRGRA